MYVSAVNCGIMYVFVVKCVIPYMCLQLSVCSILYESAVTCSIMYVSAVNCGIMYVSVVKCVVPYMCLQSTVKTVKQLLISQLHTRVRLNLLQRLRQNQWIRTDCFRKERESPARHEDF